MKKIKALILSGFFAVGAFANNYDVVAIIWPAYQPEPRWKELGIFNHGNGEWQNVYEAKPKFEGHQQPIVPLWGYERDDDPIAVARKIDAALASGINVFMYDWYWYEGRPFLENALNNGFLKAPNNERMKFFLMWANHDVNNLWNNKIGGKEKHNIHWKADVSYEEFVNVLVPRFIEYFKKPNYYKLDGKPVFVMYDMRVFTRIGPEKAKQAIQYFRKATKDAGFPGLVFWGRYSGLMRTIIPGKEDRSATCEELVKYYDIEGGFAYGAWFNDYPHEKWAELSIKKYDKEKAMGHYIPVVSTGWDNNPRFIASEFTKITKGKDPIAYEKNLRVAKDWVDKNTPKGKRKIILINAWNEWTEGGYLEPDKTYGYGFLNATARVFGGNGQSKK